MPLPTLPVLPCVLNLTRLRSCLIWNICKVFNVNSSALGEFQLPRQPRLLCVISRLFSLVFPYAACTLVCSDAYEHLSRPSTIAVVVRCEHQIPLPWGFLLSPSHILPIFPAFPPPLLWYVILFVLMLFRPSGFWPLGSTWTSTFWLGECRMQLQLGAGIRMN